MSGAYPVEAIRGQLRQAFFGESWHGDHVLKVLDSIDAEGAVARVPGTNHSIQEIVLHMATWMDVVARRVLGEDPGPVPDEEDWPAPERPDGDGWVGAVSVLRRAYEQLDEAVSRLEPEELYREIVSESSRWTVYDQLHGVVQHSLYHLGQIVILKQAASPRITPGG